MSLTGYPVIELLLCTGTNHVGNPFFGLSTTKTPDSPAAQAPSELRQKLFACAHDVILSAVRDERSEESAFRLELFVLEGQ